MSKTTNPLAGEFSPTGIETLMSCPRKFYIGKTLNLMATSKAVALDFGSAFHAAVAVFYKGEDDIKKVMSEFLAEFPMRGDSIRNPVNATVILMQYMKNYTEDRKSVRAEEVEIPFELPMPNGTMLCGVIDRISRGSGAPSVIDTKTTGSPLTDYFWNRYSNSFQLGAYDYVASQLLGDCNYITVDAVCLKSKDGSYEMSRRPFQRTEVQRAEWLNTYLFETDLAMKRIKEGNDPNFWPQRQVSCSQYGTCEFLGLCRHGLNHPSVLAEMVKRNSEGE